MEELLNHLGTKVRRITCKVNKLTGQRLWTISLYGDRTEVDGRVMAEKDIKFTGTTLEEALHKATI